MIYLTNTTVPQTLRVPRSHADLQSSVADFVLYSTVERREVHRAEVVLQPCKRFYFQFDAALPSGLRDGSYEYILSQCGEILSNGLVGIGHLDAVVKDARTGGINFKQAK